MIALLVLLWPGLGKHLALGLGAVSIVAGLAAYKKRKAARTRLLGAAAITLGLLAMILGLTKILLTVIAIVQLDRQLAP
ncbi:MAG: hypothetical protein V2A73_09325 [Pseudomonadota bacterium]